MCQLLLLYLVPLGASSSLSTCRDLDSTYFLNSFIVICTKKEIK